MNTAPVSTPCPTCPFRRTTKSGELGGSPVGTFIGQVNGPFWLPCHSCTNYSDPNWKTDYSTPQCAGAAIFRSNVGWKGSAKLATLPADRTLVFGSFQEFLAHHHPMTLNLAWLALGITTPDMLTKREMQRSGCNFVLTPKQPTPKA